MTTSGNLFAERLMTVAHTARKQRRHVLTFSTRLSGRQKLLPHTANVATFYSLALDALPHAFSHRLAEKRGFSDRHLRGFVA